MSKHRFLIDVECLFDFRLGTIATYSPKAYHDCFLNDIESYIKRDNDRFYEQTNEFTKEEFEQYYNNRDTSVFKNSMMTNVYRMLHEIKQELLSSNELKEEDSLEITLNIQHYQLSEMDEYALSVLFQKHFGYEYVVKIISVPNDKLTPELIRSNFDVVFLYDFEKWSTYFVDPENPSSLFHHPMGQVIMYIPYKLIADKNEIESAYSQVKESFEIDPMYKDNCQDAKLLLSTALLGYVHLIFCDLKYFSVTTAILTKK